MVLHITYELWELKKNFYKLSKTLVNFKKADAWLENLSFSCKTILNIIVIYNYHAMHNYSLVSFHVKLIPQTSW